MNCVHADNTKYRIDSTVCTLGLYGGRPSPGVCQACPSLEADPNYTPPVQILPQFAKTVQRLAPALVKRAAQNLSVCLGCNHHLSHTNQTVRCGKCGCSALPLWKTEDCPVGKWSEAKPKDPVPIKYLLRNGSNTNLNNLYTNATAFLICGGPSLSQLDLNLLSAPGILTMGINNSGAPFRPNMRVCVDEPSRFLESVWRDPTITKFSRWDRHNLMKSEWPNIIYFNHSRFEWWRFFSCEIVVWGNSTMIVAIRILFDLGIRRIFLLGADFSMEPGHNAYAHGEYANETSAKANNKSFGQMQKRLGLLRPLFESEDLHIYNCNFESRLTVFPFISYNLAVELATKTFGIDIDAEKLTGLYGAYLGQHTENRPTADDPGNTDKRRNVLEPAIH